MKRHILALFAFAAFAPACATNSGSPANSATSNANSPTNNAVAKIENSPAANTEKKALPKTEKSSETESKSERVSFAPGKTEAHLKRTIPANGSIDFVANAKSGQRMEFSANYDKNPEEVELFLTEPGLQDISVSGAANEPIDFTIKKTGDHRITINNKTGKPVNVDFGLFIK
jgi:hypothetical protein